MKYHLRRLYLLIILFSLLGVSSHTAFAESKVVTSGAAVTTERMQFVPMEEIAQQITSGQAIVFKSLKQQSKSTWHFQNGLLLDWRLPVVSWQGKPGIWVSPNETDLIGCILYIDKAQLKYIEVMKNANVENPVSFTGIQAKGKESNLPLDYLLMLVNKDNNIDLTYKTSLISNSKLGINGLSSVQVSKLLANDLKALFKEAKQTQGYALYCTSGYRSVEKQSSILNQEVRVLTNRGVKNPLKVARRTINLPQQSEHHTGLAVDIVSSNALTLRAFKVSKEAVWLAKNAPKYGFILRYPANKEPITGISFEQWHFRYVGREFAKLLTQEKLTLEEWIEHAKKGRIYTDSQGKKHWFVVISTKDKTYKRLPLTVGMVKCYYITPEWVGVDIML